MRTARGAGALARAGHGAAAAAWAVPGAGRLGRLLDGLRHRAVPNRWSSLLGVVAVASLVLLVVTGLVLTLVYEPSSTLVRYQGRYRLLQGVEMSEAYASTLRISLDLPGGLLVRQAHHWAALVLPAALLLQLATLFFTGGFRRPRRAAWVLLVGVLVLALVSGWSGYALPDDALSGTGLRIVEGVTLGIPLVGTWLSWVLFGGELPGRVVEHLYLVHLAAPALLVLLVVLRLRSSWRTGPAQLPGPGRSAERVVGLPLWPAAAVRAAGLSAATTGLLVLMAGTLTISPVWAHGPSSPGNAFAGSQPDWYTAFLDGALRLVPPGWEVTWLGRTWTLAVLVPLAAIGLLGALLTVHPFLESRVTGDRSDHHLLDRPRDAPTRTPVGAAGLTVYGALWAAASADLVATQFRVALEDVVGVLRAVLLLGPVVAFVVARQVCATLRAAERDRHAHGAESGQVVQLPSGGFQERHAAPGPTAQPVLGPAARWAAARRPEATGAPGAAEPGARPDLAASGRG
ncbi:cytochrome bc complex cytochrome b subunit [Microlunatus capsulatus]|uniref:Cytochrome bc1 complex cytochrome b subunit n=1 Tax=Microlunatus capsulatus TaxID=99117 RepID=A0ABS4Z7Y2_9ACTN|nr:cytochrome b N-terminal domain-containing protein [Microlunatus capsulatus]MBP2417161.1 ubiquinol-cytochrome c reductase cytochrome b subunit [Microlunatus capsulatus]